MTICEFFKNQYDEAIEKGAGTKYVCCINQETAPKGSWEWVKISADYFFGGAYQPQFEKVGITVEQLNEAKEKGFLKYKYYGKRVKGSLQSISRSMVRGCENMFWRKVFGDTMFEKVQKYAKDRNFTISTLVRLAVEKYMKGE